MEQSLSALDNKSNGSYEDGLWDRLGQRFDKRKDKRRPKAAVGSAEAPVVDDKSEE